MNRLRPHFASQVAQRPKRRLQRSIVADYRDDIIGLIADDGASLPEVADAVRAQGEPVLDAGFKSAVLKMIGTVKNIRAGRTDLIASKGGDPASQPKLPPISSAESGTSPDHDDDFAARRPRG